MRVRYLDYLDPALKYWKLNCPCLSSPRPPFYYTDVIHDFISLSLYRNIQVCAITEAILTEHFEFD